MVSPERRREAARFWTKTAMVLMAVMMVTFVLALVTGNDAWGFPSVGSAFTAGYLFMIAALEYRGLSRTTEE